MSMVMVRRAVSARHNRPYCSDSARPEKKKEQNSSRKSKNYLLFFKMENLVTGVVYQANLH